MIRLLANIWFYVTFLGWGALLPHLLPPLYMRDWPGWEVVPAILGLWLVPPLLLTAALLIAIWVLGWTFRFLRAVCRAVRLFITTMEEQPRG
jgi:hypothetical protein